MSFRPGLLTPASSSKLGLIKPDGTSLTVDVNGVVSVAGVTVASMTDAGTLSSSDVFDLSRSTTDMKTTGGAVATLVHRLPAGSRTVALPAVLTSTDNDKNVVLTGTTGNLSVDGTVADGFRCHVINTASGAATYSGITGLLATTSLASGAATTILMAGATVYATAPGSTTVSPATAFTTAPTSITGASGTPQTLTFTPNGSWQAGQSVGLALTTVAGAFATATNGTITGSGASWTFTPTAGGSAAATVQFTPSSAAGTSGTITVSGTSITATTTSVAVSVTAAAATAFTTAPTSATVASGSAQTLTFTPNGNWQAGQAIPLTLVTVAGAFATAVNGAITGSGSSWTFTPTSGNGSASTIQFTPSSANGTSGSITVGGTSITATNTSVAITVAGSSSALLDNIATPVVGAYSLRKLRAAYAGSAIRVQRSTPDTTQQDIGFDGSGNLNTTALSAFVGSGTGTVVTWYDQSTAGKNLTTGLNANPSIVTAGAQQALNNATAKPAINFTPSNVLQTPVGFAIAGNTYAAFGVAGETSAAQPAGRIVSYTSSTTGATAAQNDITTGSAILAYYSNTSHVITTYSGGAGSTVAKTVPYASQFASVYTGTQSIVTVDGTAGSAVANTASLTTGGVLAVGCSPNNTVDASEAFSGPIAEVIVTQGTLAAGDQATIRTSQQTYYGTT